MPKEQLAYDATQLKRNRVADITKESYAVADMTLPDRGIDVIGKFLVAFVWLAVLPSVRSALKTIKENNDAI